MDMVGIIYPHHVSTVLEFFLMCRTSLDATCDT